MLTDLKIPLKAEFFRLHLRLDVFLRLIQYRDSSKKCSDTGKQELWIAILGLNCRSTTKTTNYVWSIMGFYLKYFILAKY